MMRTPCHPEIRQETKEDEMSPVTFSLFAASGVFFLLYLSRRRARLNRETE